MPQVDLSKLSNEELVLEYKQSKSEIVFKEILKKNNGIIKRTVSKCATYDQIRYSYEDYEQVALIGVLKAVNNFDESKGFKFTTLLGQCMINELSNYVKPITRANKDVNRKEYKIVNINQLHGQFEDLQLIEVIPYEVDLFQSNFEGSDLVSSIYNSVTEILTSKQRIVFDLLLQGLDPKKIASEIGVSDKNIYALMKSIKGKCGHFRELIVE